MPAIQKPESFLERAINLPLNLINNFIEDLQCWDFELIGDRISYPIGITSNFILFLFAIGRISETESIQQADNSYLSFFDLSNIGKLLLIVETLIIILSLLNWLNLFIWSSKNYQLFLAKVDDMDIFLNKNAELKPIFDRLPWWGNKWYGRWLYALVKDYLPKSGEEIIHLKVWCPSKFQLNLACLLSPANLFIHYYFTYTNWYSLSALNLAIILQNLLFKTQFEQLIKDKQLIHSQLINEYNVKFVNNLFKRTEVKSTQTDSDLIEHEVDKELDKRREQLHNSDNCEHLVSAKKYKSKSPLNPFQTGRYYPNIS